MSDYPLVTRAHDMRHKALTEYREITHWAMSEQTLKALASECGVPVEDPDAWRDKDGELLYPTPPQFLGIQIKVNDELGYGVLDLALKEIFGSATQKEEQ